MTNCNGYAARMERRDLLQSTQVAYRLPSAVEPPDEIDHRGWLQIENQGAEGSCSGHATSSVLEVCNYIATGGDVIQLSRMFCYLSGQIEAGLIGSDCGCTIQGVVESAKKRGVCMEATFPYSGRYETGIPDAAVFEAGGHQARSHCVMQSERDCFTFLASGVGGIICGVPWIESLARNPGVVEQLYGSTLGMHAIPLVGYSKTKDSQGRNFYWLPNSHGRQWGANGWAEISPSIVEYWIKSSCVVIGVSDLAAYGPRKIKSFRGIVG